MNKYFIIFGIIAVMLLVGFSGCFGNNDGGNEVAPTATLNLIPGDVLNASSNQTLAILTHRSGDAIKYSEIRKFSFSNDGQIFYIIDFDDTDHELDVDMNKGDNIGDPDLFEVGEIIYFQENGGNWDAADDFYLKIVHRATKSTIYEDNVDLV